MSNNKRIIEDTYKAFSRGDLQYIVDACAEDVVWSYYGFPGLPLIGNFKGKPGVKQFFESLRLTSKPLDHKWNEFIIDGDSAVVIGTAKVQIQSTGKAFDHTWCHVYTLKEGKIATFRGFISNPYGMAIAFNAL
jgi:ketosteroid isomerase-like protein